jgi:CRISPR/Cas system-associated protein Cas10 (large subunit of type III CRISPR-Cas system)
MMPQQPPRRLSEREDEDKDEKHEAEDANSEEDEGDESPEGEEEEDTFVCRLCGKAVDVGDGEETFALCDRCASQYDIDKMWDDLDDEKISEHQAKTINLGQYRKRRGPPKPQKGGQYRGPPKH